jgi:hypothetical protein
MFSLTGCEVVDVHVHQHQRDAAGGRLGNHRLQLGVAGAKAVGGIIDADRGRLGFHIGSLRESTAAMLVAW